MTRWAQRRGTRPRQRASGTRGPCRLVSQRLSAEASRGPCERAGSVRPLQMRVGLDGTVYSKQIRESERTLARPAVTDTRLLSESPLAGPPKTIPAPARRNTRAARRPSRSVFAAQITGWRCTPCKARKSRLAILAAHSKFRGSSGATHSLPASRRTWCDVTVVCV